MKEKDKLEILLLVMFIFICLQWFWNSSLYMKGLSCLPSLWQDVGKLVKLCFKLH